MITGKIILKSGTKLTLDKRFTDIAKHTPANPPRPIQQQANVIIPYSRQELFGNKKTNVLSIAQRLKKRSINYRLGLNANASAKRLYVAPTRPAIFQRLSFGNRRRMNRSGNSSGVNRYLFGGQSGMGVRLGAQGRIRGTRTFRARTRGYLNNNNISRYSVRGNRNNRGRRNTNNNNFNRSNRGRFRKQFSRGRGRNNTINNKVDNSATKESLDMELDKYMAQTKLENDPADITAI